MIDVWYYKLSTFTYILPWILTQHGPNLEARPYPFWKSKAYQQKISRATDALVCKTHLHMMPLGQVGVMHHPDFHQQIENLHHVLSTSCT